MRRRQKTIINYQISIIHYFRGFFLTINLSDYLPLTILMKQQISNNLDLSNGVRLLTEKEPSFVENEATFLHLFYLTKALGMG
jgi:hypothetical protein